MEDKVAVRKIGFSLGGLDIFSIVIHDRKKKASGTVTTSSYNQTAVLESKCFSGSQK